MVQIRPFRALRPPAALAERVAALPYDVMSTKEARLMAAGNSHSFLHVSRPEIDLSDEIDPYDEQVHAQGRRNLDRLIRGGDLIADETPTFSVYRQRMGDHVQTGLVVLASIDEYESGVVAKHELTRPEKELDRVRHIDALGAQDEPVFLLAPVNEEIARLLANTASEPPLIDIVTEDGVQHCLWVIAEPAEIDVLQAVFAHAPRLYVADGHHRSAAAARVRGLRRERRAAGPADDGFLAVVFTADQLAILPYHRAVADLAGLQPAQFMASIERVFDTAPVAEAPAPGERHVLGMYLGGTWYRLAVRPGDVDEGDTVGRLDVSILQDRVLAPLLGISDPRTDPRLSFVGGIRGTRELERLVDGRSAAVAFALHATSVHDLVTLADAGRTMPPKSTWFEPKLRSGLFVHALDPAHLA